MMSYDKASPNAKIGRSNSNDPELLEQLVREGKTNREIALILDLDYGSVAPILSRYGIKRDPNRPCKRCGGPIGSTNTRQLYAYGEFCDHLQEKSLAEFLKDGEHAVPEDLWIGSCVQEQAQILTRKEQMEEFMFLGLRMNEGVTRAAFEKSFGVPIEAVYLETLRKLKEQGLLQMVAGRIALTDKGMDLANYVMAKFLL